MKTMECYRIIRDLVDLNQDMFGLLEECFKEIFPNKKELAVHLLEQDIEGRDYCGCLQSLSCFKDQINGKVE